MCPRNYYGHAVVQWLRYCATNRKVTGSITDGVIGICDWHNPSGRTMALGFTQPLREVSTRNSSWAKGGWCVGLTTLPPCADCVKIDLLELSGPVKACNGIALPSTYSFLRGWVNPQRHSAARRIMSITNSIDTIGIRTRDRPSCSTVPQPTAPPAACPDY
jgi:hypothetical protein